MEGEEGEEGWGGEGAASGRVRRGSEGLETRALDREEILRRYVASRGVEAGRYKRYVPEPPSEPEDEDEDGEEDETLAQRVERWRAREAGGGTA
jgi:hypothetical protein